MLIIDAAVRGSLILLAALAASHLLRRRSAATRHAVWAGAIALQLLLPIAAAWGPHWRVPLPRVVTSLVAPMAPAQAVDSTPDAPLGADVGVAKPSTGLRVDASPALPTPHVAAPRERVAPRTLSVATLATALWITGVLVILVRLAIGTAYVAMLAHRGARVNDGQWLALAQGLAGTLHLHRPLTLLRGHDVGVPVTWGIVYPVVLLPEDADAWPEERRRFVLVHEMAHVKRLDALTQLVGQLVLAVFWFNPLVWIANRRMQLEREHACDDYVLRLGTQPSHYAEELLTMVRALGTTSHRAAQPAFAALAMARRSEFEGRMLSILDPVLDRHPLSRGRATMSALAALLLVAPLAALQPYRAAEPMAPTASASVAVVSTASPCNTVTLTSNTGSNTHIHADDDGGDGSTVFTYFNTSANRCAEAFITGKVRFNDAESDIVSMSPGSRAIFRERTPVATREVIVMPARGGVEHTATLDGRAQPYDDGMSRWLAGFLPDVLREGGINVQPRVARLRAEGGVSRVLEVIASMRSTGARKSHYEALLDGGRLSDDEVDRVMRQAGTDLRASSGDLSSLLSTAGRRGYAPSAAALTTAVGGISSSGDRTRVLQTYGQSGDRDMLLAVMRAATDISSSGDKARLLQVLAPRYLAAHDAGLQRAWFQTLSGVPSSGDVRTVLTLAVPYAVSNEELALAVIATTVQSMSSSGDRASVLVRLADAGALRPSRVRDAYMTAVRSLSSADDMRTALEAAARH